MRQDNFKKCWCHRFSKIFQRTINSRMNANSGILRKNHIENCKKCILKMLNIGKIYNEHKICEILNCDMTKALKQDFPNLKFQIKF